MSPCATICSAPTWRPTLAVWFDSTLCPCGCQRVTRKSKKEKIASNGAIAISHPDQWGFWEWLGQTPRTSTAHRMVGFCGVEYGGAGTGFPWSTLTGRLQLHAMGSCLLFPAMLASAVSPPRFSYPWYNHARLGVWSWWGTSILSQMPPLIAPRCHLGLPAILTGVQRRRLPYKSSLLSRALGIRWWMHYGRCTVGHGVILTQLQRSTRPGLALGRFDPFPSSVLGRGGQRQPLGPSAFAVLNATTGCASQPASSIACTYSCSGTS
jgi:hypothetical protein